MSDTTLRREAEQQILAQSNSCMCPISLALMREPVVAADGHTYERVEIERWIQLKRDNAKSPMTNEILADTRLTKPRAESQHRRGARHRRLRGGPAAHKPEKAPREVLDSNFRCAQAAGAV